jgi:hypothetical protein
MAEKFGEAEYVASEGIDLANEERQKSREKKLEPSERIKEMDEDPVVKSLRARGVTMDSVFRVNNADEIREKGKIFKEGIELVGITGSEDYFESRGDAVSDEELYVISTKGEMGAGQSGLHYLGVDKRDAEMARLIMYGCLGNNFAEGGKPDGKIKISKARLDKLRLEHNMRVENDKRKSQEKDEKEEGAADINFRS